jgi:hypothetical protein
MERDALIIRELALDLVKEVLHLSCSFDMGEQIQRNGTAMHLFFGEIFDAAGSGDADRLAENALLAAYEFRTLMKFNTIEAIGAQKMELLVFTLRTYRLVDGKFRKFARHNAGDQP